MSREWCMAIKILGVIGCFGRVAVLKTRLRPLLVSETSKQVKQSDHGKGVRLIVNADCLLVCLLVSFIFVFYKVQRLFQHLRVTSRILSLVAWQAVGFHAV